jgi:hypothetical protein
MREGCVRARWAKTLTSDGVMTGQLVMLDRRPGPIRSQMARFAQGQQRPLTGGSWTDSDGELTDC